MSRNASSTPSPHRNTAAPLRRLPKIPHPSWRKLGGENTSATVTLNADEFWARIGI